MPILKLHTVASRPLKQLATQTPSCLRVQIRCRHDAAAYGSTLAPNLQSQPNLGKETGGHAHLKRARKHGFKSLPMSPLMRDGSARRPQKPIAPRDDASVQEFRNEVATNLYAQALASPIRHCSLTMARLPSHFLIPFTTTIQRPPTTTSPNTPRMKAVIKPGRSADCTEPKLAQTSYLLNRQDLVRHLARKRHWTILVTERQKGKLATMANRSANAQKLVQDYWTWEDQVDATAAMLEKQAVAVLKRVMKAHSTQNPKASNPSKTCAYTLAFDHGSSDGSSSSFKSAEGDFVYELPALLSPEGLSALETELGQGTAGYVHMEKSSEACQAQLALERLRVYKEANDILKNLPKVQNPPGTRDARQEQRRAALAYSLAPIDARDEQRNTALFSAMSMEETPDEDWPVEHQADEAEGEVDDIKD